MRRAVGIFVVLMTVCAIVIIQPVSGSGEKSKDSGKWPSQGYLENFCTFEASPDIFHGEFPGPDDNVVIIMHSQYKIEDDNEPPFYTAAMINVTNVLWNGVPWYSEIDDTVWHRNVSSPGPYYYRIDDYTVKFVIWNKHIDPSTGRVSYYFPPGSDVTFWIYASNKTRVTENNQTYWKNHYLESHRYTFEVKGAWPYKPTNTPKDELFEKNINLTIEPMEPNTGDAILVRIASRSDVEIAGAYLQIEGWYANGTPMGREVYEFKPENKTWPSLNATCIIPAKWQAEPNAVIKFNVTAWDRWNHEITSNNYTIKVSEEGIWKYPGKFDANIEVFFDPDITFDDTLMPGTPLNITIKSRFEHVAIEEAYLHYSMYDPWYNITLRGKIRFNKISSTERYVVFPGQSPGVEVEFYITAYDIADNKIQSANYSYKFEDVTLSPPKNKGIFYVRIYDYAAGGYVKGVNVTFLNATWRCTTQTNEFGLAYPNVTGQKYTPYFLSLNETYKVIVVYGEYNLSVMYDLKYNQSGYEIIEETKNYTIIKNNNTIEFIFNKPKPPPVFAAVVPFPTWSTIGGIVGCAIALPVVYVIYSRKRKKIEAERRRITV